jgi:hypothetical protein
MDTLFPQKAGARWLLLSRTKDTCHIDTYRTFLRAAIEYSKRVRG